MWDNVCEFIIVRSTKTVCTNEGHWDCAEKTPLASCSIYKPDSEKGEILGVFFGSHQVGEVRQQVLFKDTKGLEQHMLIKKGMSELSKI